MNNVLCVTFLSAQTLLDILIFPMVDQTEKGLW